MERLVVTSESIVKDDKGRMKRVYLEQQVLAPQPLIDLQRDLSEQIKFKFAPIDDLHLTLFHYGKPLSLYQDIISANPRLTLNEFMSHFCGVLEHNLGIISGDIPVKGQSLELFGDATNPVLAVKLQKPSALLEIRSRILQRFNRFLQDCSIKDVDDFMQGSSNLKYQTESNYNPHLSIGFPDQPIAMPTFDVSKMVIVLGSPQLANVRVRI